jgi:heat shock protein HslJ
MARRTGILLIALITGVCGAFEAAASELADTSWRLVQIMSMDDRVDMPDDRAQYTLELRADGTATMQADCNRGNGSWMSESASQLKFRAVASTRALCPSGSLSERYLAQFEWVRSYVMKDGHLFLATMADGSIIEFEPAGGTSPAASVLGEEIRTADPGEMQQTILTRLFDQYATQRGIEAETAEIATLIENMRRGMAAKGLTAENELAPEEATELDTMRREMAGAIIRQWKINKALYDQYGGRIIYQQLGPEPLDAYRRFLEQRQTEGAFTINDPALAKRFWHYFSDESIHDFMEPGSTDEASAFVTPPWEKKP